MQFKIIPSLQQQISPQTIVHMYKEAIEQPEGKNLKMEKRRFYFVLDVLERCRDCRKVRMIIHYGLSTTPAGEFKEESYFQRSSRTGRPKDEGVVVKMI